MGLRGWRRDPPPESAGFLRLKPALYG